MRRRAFIAASTLAAASRFAPAAAMVPRTSLRDKLTTRAEATNFAETSTVADVVAFFAELDQRGAPIAHGSIGKTFEGRDIPYVVASRPLVRTPAEAFALHRPIVFVQATIDASKVEGKEAILAIVRDLCLSPQKTLLEDLVLVVVPILNVDGNEHVGEGYLEAPEQNGPARVGTRTNAQGIELDNDFVRAEAPETRALLRFVRAWRPDVFLDLTSSGGSFHDFGITFAPSLHPAAYYGGVYVRDHLLPSVRKEVHAKFGIESFPFGRFGRTRALPEPPPASDVENFGWFPRDYRPRLGTNYMGLRGILAVLIASYAHDPLERRIFTMRAFVESVFGYCSDNDDEVSAASHTTDRWIGGTVPVRAMLPAEPTGHVQVAFENLALDSSPDHEAGVPLGFKRTSTYDNAVLPIYERYVGFDYRIQPKAFIVPAAYASLVEPSLHAHAIDFEIATQPEDYLVQDYLVDGIEKTLVPENGHDTILLSGSWREKRPFRSSPGDLVIPGPQPFGPLVSVLLEPESDDGFFAWNVFDRVLAAGALAPMLRVASDA